MRRFRQMLPGDEVVEILNSSWNGVLSLTDVDGEPYGVPLSFAFDGVDSIYFHSAMAGHKIECMSVDDRASFCVIAKDDIKPEEFTTYFKSVIARGRISIVCDKDEVMRGLHLLCDKYSPGVDSVDEIAKCINRVLVFKLKIISMTGKEAIELTRMRK